MSTEEARRKYVQEVIDHLLALSDGSVALPYKAKPPNNGEHRR